MIGVRPRGKYPRPRNSGALSAGSSPDRLGNADRENEIRGKSPRIATLKWSFPVIVVRASRLHWELPASRLEPRLQSRRLHHNQLRSWHIHRAGRAGRIVQQDVARLFQPGGAGALAAVVLPVDADAVEEVPGRRTRYTSSLPLNGSLGTSGR